MKRNSRSRAAQVMLLGLALAASATEVLAALGRAPTAAPVASTSIPAPTVRMAATAPVSQASAYTRHETVLASGTVVLEYATPDAVVFAVAWRGPVLPDLSELLGGYFSTFKHETEQARLRGVRGGPVSIERGDLVVSSHGRMRSFLGYAYAPDLVPVDVNIKDVLQ